MSLTFGFTNHLSQTSSQSRQMTNELAERIHNYLQTYPDGINGYASRVFNDLINAANTYAASVAAQQAVEATPVFYPSWSAGIWVTRGEKYRHNNSTWRVIQSHTTQVGWEPANVPALFVLEQADPPPVGGGDLPWVAGEAVTAGMRRVFNSITYSCITGHTTQIGWEPPNVPALWAVV